MSGITFEAPMDRPSKIGTITLIILLAIIDVIIFRLALADGPMWAGYLSIVLTGSLLAYLYCASPRRYEVSDEGIRILRGCGSVLIPLEDIRDVRRYEGPRPLRIAGAGIAFGYFGKYRLGEDIARAYMTNLKEIVIVETDEAAYALSPGDVEGFVENVRELAGLS